MGDTVDEGTIERAVKVFREDGIIVFAKKYLVYAKDYAQQKIRNLGQALVLPYVMPKIKKFNQNYSLEELVKFSFDTCRGYIRPAQIHDEILGLLKILDKMRPKIVVEIGTDKGGTLFLFSHVASEDAILISVDLPHGRFGGGYPNWKIPLYKSFAIANQKIYLIRADSHDQNTFKKVKEILKNKYIDFLFIDGDHFYNGVKKDFEMYRSLVKEGGIIAFHDIVPGPERNVGGVPKFWMELKEKYSGKEIVKDWNNRTGWGIGWVKK